MIVYFSTVVRATPQDQGGEIIMLDWDRKEVLTRAPIVPKNPRVADPNPRGSTRGGRGILVDNDEVLVASYHSIHVFDRTLNFVRQISNPLFTNLHELAWDGMNIWVTSTDIDAAIKIDRSGKTVDSWWSREDPLVSNRYNLTPLEIDKEKDNRTSFVGLSNTTPSHVHLNAVAMWHNRPLMLLNRFGSVMRLYPTEIVLEDASLRGCHNILVTPEGFILINDTLGKALRVYNAEGSLLKSIDLVDFSPVRKILRRQAVATMGLWLGQHGRPASLFLPLLRRIAIARPIFVRGLCQTSRQTVLIGISPAAILEIDWHAGKLTDMYVYSNNRHVCVHGIAWNGSS